MTVSGGSKAFYRVVGLERGELPHMARGMAAFHKSQATIVVDCSNLMFGVGSKVKSAAEYLFEFARSGVTILPVCDNDVRPSVKQETIKRRANREKARTKEYLLRREIRALKRRLNEEALTQQQRSELSAAIKAKETERKRKETASHRPAIPDFANELEKELDLLGAHIANEAGGSVLKVVTAQCQADTYMAGQIRNKLAVMVLSTDTDIPLITGDSCISIKGFSKKNFELVSTSKATLEKAMTFLGAGTKAELVAAVHPIFEQVNDDRLRSLMMLISGCDVFPSGLKNVGITTLSKAIDEFKKAACDPEDETALFEHLVEVMKKEFKPRLIEEIKEVYADEADAFADVEAEEVVQAHLDALVYEPTNKVIVEIDGERRVVRFLNIYDKGYRAKMAAWENGRQLVLQPDFKESDKTFNRDQTISSASVASDRGGNERVVNVSKRAGLISKGFQSNADPTRFNKIWLTWSFQANFMFDRVL